MRDRCRCHRTNWLRKLKGKGLLPRVQLLETCTEEDATDTERFWIAFVRSTGAELVNQTDGGDGMTRPSLAVRMKMSVAQKGIPKGPCSLDRARKISEAKKGKPNGRLGFVPSVETREKLRRAHTGRRSPNKGIPRLREHVQKAVATRLRNAKPMPESFMVWVRENHPGRKPVVCVTTGERYPSLAAAVKAKRCGESTIRESINRGIVRGGLLWKWADAQAN
jgi:hypothetical protein